MSCLRIVVRKYILFKPYYLTKVVPNLILSKYTTLVSVVIADFKADVFEDVGVYGRTFEDIKFPGHFWDALRPFAKEGEPESQELAIQDHEGGEDEEEEETGISVEFFLSVKFNSTGVTSLLEKALHHPFVKSKLKNFKYGNVP